jgi:hypothetical protein
MLLNKAIASKIYLTRQLFLQHLQSQLSRLKSLLCFFYMDPDVDIQEEEVTKTDGKHENAENLG